MMNERRSEAIANVTRELVEARAIADKLGTERYGSGEPRSRIEQRRETKNRIDGLTEVLVWLTTQVELSDATVKAAFDLLNDEYHVISIRWGKAYEGKNVWEELRASGLIPDDVAVDELVDAADDAAQAAT